MDNIVHKGVRKLLKALECIKKAFPTKKECEGPKAGATEGGSSEKGMVSFSNQIPKKSHKEAKHCALCKKHGGMQNTHNRGNYCKYKKDGIPKKAFAGKRPQCNPPNRNAPCEQNTSYM